MLACVLPEFSGFSIPPAPQEESGEGKRIEDSFTPFAAGQVNRQNKSFEKHLASFSPLAPLPTVTRAQIHDTLLKTYGTVLKGEIKKKRKKSRLAEGIGL